MKIDIPTTLEEWNARGAEYLPGHMGLTFSEVSPEAVRGRLTVKGELMSWNGFLHAGAIVSLADSCAGYGALVTLPEGADGFTTIDLASNFLGTALEGAVDCVATPLHLGRTTQVWDAAVTNAQTGKRMAQFRCTQMILWPRS